MSDTDTKLETELDNMVGAVLAWSVTSDQGSIWVYQVPAHAVGVLRPYFIINTSHSHLMERVRCCCWRVIGEFWKGEHTICHSICWLFCLITASSRLLSRAHFRHQTVAAALRYKQSTADATHCAAPDITTHLNIIIGPIQSKYLHAPQKQEYFREHSLVFLTRSAVKLWIQFSLCFLCFFMTLFLALCAHFLYYPSALTCWAEFMNC